MKVKELMEHQEFLTGDCIRLSLGSSFLQAPPSQTATSRPFMIGISSESCYMNWMWKNRMTSRLRDSCRCCGTLMRVKIYLYKESDSTFPHIHFFLVLELSFYPCHRYLWRGWCRNCMKSWILLSRNTWHNQKMFYNFGRLVRVKVYKYGRIISDR